MITIIVTAWEEPEQIKETLRRITTQRNLKDNWEIIAIAPDKPTEEEITKYAKRFPNQISFFPQPRKKGKNEMLNFLIKKAKGDIIIFTDGDVYFNDIAVSEIVKAYKNPEIGAVTGRIIPQNSRSTMMGYWAHLLTHGANKIRFQKSQKKEFLECSGYLYSIRKSLIDEIPLDVAEDSMMPLIIWKKGYKIAYVPKAIGEVLYPENLEKWFSQKVRCAKSHEKLDNYGGKKIRMKTFKNEVIKGTFWALKYPKTMRELYWTFLLFYARLRIWTNFYIDTRIKDEHYGETWTKVHGTKRL